MNIDHLARVFYGAERCASSSFRHVDVDPAHHGSGTLARLSTKAACLLLMEGNALPYSRPGLNEQSRHKVDLNVNLQRI